MTARIKACFERAAGEGRAALIPYIMAGTPSLDATVGLMHTLKASGADLIELGVPFSDPMADGPVIQKAGEHALENQTSLDDVLKAVATFRRDDDALPVILMTYLNPVERMGESTFAAVAATAGVDGILVVDLPPEEAQSLIDVLGKYDITMIFLLSLTTVAERIDAITAIARGFVYCISLKGVTGSDRLDINQIADNVATIKSKTTLPVGVGFGIRDADTAMAIANIADAVIVGSALVQLIEKHADDIVLCKEAVAHFISDLRRSVNAANHSQFARRGVR